MNAEATQRLRAAVAGTDVEWPAGTETVTVAVDDLVALLVDFGSALEARQRLANAVQVAESFLARIAKVTEGDLPLYRSVIDHVQALMAAAGVPVQDDSLLPV